MAFSTGSSNGRFTRGRRGASIGTMAEMNVVPLVDVVLVLLIVFMLTARAMDYGLDIQVPKVKSATETAEELPVVTVSKKGDYTLNDKKVKLAQLGDEVRRNFKNAKGVYLKADENAAWGAIAQIMSQLKQDNLEIRAVTETTNSNK
jgi:biopolymer transport protein TolR